MCTMGISLGLQVASAIWSGVSQNSLAKSQASAAERAAESQAELLRRNAERARSDAEEVTKQETNALRDMVTEQRGIAGQQHAAIGASGTTLSSGDVMNIDASTAMLAEQDLDATRSNYANSRLQYLTESQQYDWNAENTIRAGKNQANAIRAQGKTSLLGSLLSSAGLVANNWDSLFGAKKTASTGSSLTIKNDGRTVSGGTQF